MEDITIRKSTKADIKTLLTFIKELAEFEQEPLSSIKMTEETLLRDGFETNNPLFYSLIIEANNTPIGFALYFYNYSTWEGKGLYLEDLYVQEKYRNQGVGTKTLKYIANIAINDNCSRFQWQVI